MTSLEEIDLRLLRIFEAMHAKRHVTLAAEEMGLSQPTISIGLGKLRKQFSDPLFVRTNEGMQPTSRADVLIGPIRDVLHSVRHICELEATFDPASAARRFRICMTDASHITLLPLILAAVRKAAPSVTLEAGRIDQSMPQALQSGEADLALGLIPSLETGFYQQTLFPQDFICLTGPRHPRIKKSLTLAQYQAEEHIGIVSGTGQQLLEEAVKRFGLQRRVMLQLPGFLGLTGILAASDLIVTLPRHIGETLAELGGLRIHACPFPIPPFFVKQHWHARYHHDMANRWLRSLCAGLFLRKCP
ncbi:LysR family transcriptional regulator [Bradyrhizobium tropiciagri]|uniref:LysR family transcriptional regulator n=1 Tax=Bradyrhizobium tropiciagri TaxID=312253 RepID=UPI00201236BE|nr:LysR family transcriptional regulator [Bradyrhizobium tropiciagri]